MSHFAEVDINGNVLRVIVAEQDFIDSGAVGNPTSWIQTSYNTHCGKHTLGKTPLRGNYAGLGFAYDKALDAFIPLSPFPSWVLDVATYSWKAPVPKPDGTGLYVWSEEKNQWVSVPVVPRPTK